jgi:hypothetical protein
MFISVLNKLLNWVSQILSSKEEVPVEPEPELEPEIQQEDSSVDREFYNQASSEKLGWESSWWGCEYIDEELFEAVKAWQEKNSMTADGLVGPMTYRRIWTEREDTISDHEPKRGAVRPGDKYIVHNGKFLPIEWDKVVLWDEEDGLKIEGGHYKWKENDRKPDQFVNHWDVCLSAESCARVINKKGIGIHFCIDNDGTIYQTMDTQHGAWHCGDSYGNKHGIGVEISNAYYLKYQGWYERHGFGPRPVVAKGEAVVHGQGLKEHLDFYPVQIEALKALWKAVHLGLGIPLEAPVKASGEPILGTDPRCNSGEFKGFNHHYHYTTKKIDCAGLDIWALLEEVKEELA